MFIHNNNMHTTSTPYVFGGHSHTY